MTSTTAEETLLTEVVSELQGSEALKVEFLGLKESDERLQVPEAWATYLKATRNLVKKLKSENFPLVRQGCQIINIVPPTIRMSGGCWYLQLGITRPGTLSFKYSLPGGQVRPIELSRTELPWVQHVVKNLNEQFKKSEKPHQLEYCSVTHIETKTECLLPTNEIFNCDEDLGRYTLDVLDMLVGPAASQATTINSYVPRPVSTYSGRWTNYPLDTLCTQTVDNPLITYLSENIGSEWQMIGLQAFTYSHLDQMRNNHNSLSAVIIEMLSKMQQLYSKDWLDRLIKALQIAKRNDLADYAVNWRDNSQDYVQPDEDEVKLPLPIKKKKK